jgi:hypothetical protein
VVMLNPIAAGTCLLNAILVKMIQNAGTNFT